MTWLRRAILVSLLAGAAASGGEDGHPRMGFYQWVSHRPAGDARDLLTIARERIVEAGFGLMRLYVGARYDYRAPYLSPLRFPELADRRPARIMTLPHYRAVLDDPRLSTIVLTVYPSRDYGAGADDVNLLRAWSPAHEQAEYYQIAELCEWLYANHGTLAKTVILANTEADDKMLEIMNYTGRPELAIQNLRAWQNTRYRALEDVRKRHPRAALRLLMAFEISLVNLRIGERNGRFEKSVSGSWSALANVVSHVAFDLLSYSAYESTNSPFASQRIDTPAADVGRRLERDLRFLAGVTGKPVMIGELGFARDRFDGLATGDHLVRLRSALEAVARLRPPFVVLWQVFDQPPQPGDATGYGLLERGAPAGALLKDFARRYPR